ncbi:MAG: hypothetical protein JNJ77_16730, partial [Planctomycetia bacterium]|nr:hypothetical protein [Planctomycetia bacterium]
VTFSRDEYGSASHMTLSLTSINYQETGSGLVTTSVEVRNHSTSLMTSMEEFFYNNSESLELTGAATGFDFNSSRHSGLVGYFDNSTATLVRHNESRSTFTALQVADYANSQGMLGEYSDGEYSYSSMSYQSTATLSSLATATSLNTLLNKDVYRMLDAMPDSNGMSMNSDPGDGAVGSSTSSSSGNSIVTYINNLRVVTDTTSTSASSGLETYSSLGQYANFSTSLTSFSHRSSGQSLSTMNFTEMLTGTMSESSLGSHASESGGGSTAGSGIRNGSGASTSGGLTNGGALFTYNTETTGHAYSSMVFSTRQEGNIPADLGTELTYYESRVTLSAEQYAEEEEVLTEFIRTMTQTDGTSDDTGSSSMLVPQPFSGPYEYEADDRTNDSSQTVTHGFEATRTGLRESFAEQFRTSYEYGTYSEGDYNLSSATYYSIETATVSFSHTSVLENETTVEKAGYNHRVNNWAHSGSSDKYTADNETHTHDTIQRSVQTIVTAGNSSSVDKRFEQGVYSHGSYSYSSIAYDAHYYASTSAISSIESSMFTATEYGRRTITDMSATQNHWNNLNKPTGFVLIEWFAEFTQSITGIESDITSSARDEHYTSVIRGTSSGQDFSFSLISSTYEATTTDSVSNGTSFTSLFTGYHTTGLVGVYRDIEGEINSSVNVNQTSSTFINKQHLGSMYNGVACVVYDKTLSEASQTITNSSSYVISYEGDHADFEVYSYDSSDVTITNGYSMQEYSEVSFDPGETDPWSLVSYTSINTVTNGYTYDEESIFNLSQRWTTSGGGSNGSHTYNHERERTDTGSFDVTFVEEKYGYSEPDGSGGYSFVFDDYSITNSYTEDGEYTNVGFAESFGVITAMFFGASTYEHRYDWDKERERDGSGSESITGHTTGGEFEYDSYSKSFSRDDTGDYFGVHQSAGTGSLYFWSHATLIYDETLEYRHTADLDEYEVSIDFAAPWTLTYTTDSTPLTTMTGATLETHTDSGEDEKKVPAPPMPLAMNFQGAKNPDYYGLSDRVVASYGDKKTAPSGGGGNGNYRIAPIASDGSTPSVSAGNKHGQTILKGQRVDGKRIQDEDDLPKPKDGYYWQSYPDLSDNIGKTPEMRARPGWVETEINENTRVDSAITKLTPAQRRELVILIASELAPGLAQEQIREAIRMLPLLVGVGVAANLHPATKAAFNGAMYLLGIHGITSEALKILMALYKAGDAYNMEQIARLATELAEGAAGLAANGILAGVARSHGQLVKVNGPLTAASKRALVKDMLRRLIYEQDGSLRVAPAPYHGPKSRYTEGYPNRSALGKTPTPRDAEAVYGRAIPDPDNTDAVRQSWYGRSADGKYYRYQGTNGEVHFNGIIDWDKLPSYIRYRFKQQGFNS